jgi:hypothetical protein
MESDPVCVPSGGRRIVTAMVQLADSKDASQPLPASLSRRNRAEASVRDRLTSIDDVYVLRSSWHRNGAGPEPLVAVIARTDDSRELARRALGDIAGLTAEAWRSAWKPLSLHDWMIWVYPERAGV